MKIIDKLAATLKRTRPKDYPLENGVVFVHKSPQHGNIGDYLCSPRHYFSFLDPVPGLTIVGGGAFAELAVKKAKKEKWPLEKTVLWGVGQSIRFGENLPPPVDALPFIAWGTRDVDMVVSRDHFLPCVSCLHPMLDNPVGPLGSTLLFVNFDPKVTSPQVHKALTEFCDRNGWRLLFNNCSESELIEAFGLSETILTNSFHGIYWGLLSGRRVVCLGYSSKFTSLLKSVEVGEDKLIQLGRGDGESLLEALSGNGLLDSAVSLPDSSAFREAFRNLNRSFAKNLSAMGLCSSVEEKTWNSAVT